MIAIKPTRTMEFGEQDETFIKKLAKDIGCHYSMSNKTTYNLSRSDSNNKREMGVFAWVHKEDDEYFWVATRRAWMEEAKARVVACKEAIQIDCFPRDYDRNADSICLDTKDSYEGTIKALKLINQLVKSL